MEQVVIQLAGDWWGNGQPGMMQNFQTFMDRSIATTTAVERMTEQRHRENSDKLDAIMADTSRKSLWWTIAGVVFAFVGLIIGTLAIIVTLKVVKADNVRDLLHSSAPASISETSTVPTQ